MRRDVQEIFRATPTQKQVMMFSATLSPATRPVCKKFMQNPLEIYVDDETKLTLHGLQQYYVKLEEAGKNRKLNDLLDNLEFNQVRSAPQLARLMHAGLHLRQVGVSRDRARQIAAGVQLPVNLHSLGPSAGGAHSQVPAVQGL